MIYLTGISLIPPTSVSKSQLPWSTWPWWGIFHQIREITYKTTIYRDKIYRLLAIIVFHRLVPQDCWLVVVLAQNERGHGRSDGQQFCFCGLMRDGRVRKRFLKLFARGFLAKRSSNGEFGEKSGGRFST